jgi:hypothetical protein
MRLNETKLIFQTKEKMAFDAKVFRILIASPGDVNDERDLIPEIIEEWNAVNAIHTKVVLMPVKWETHSAPMLGDRP